MTDAQLIVSPVIVSDALDTANPKTVILIDDRVLVRTCLAACIRASKLSCTVSVFDNTEQGWQAASMYSNVALIIVAVGGRKQTDTVIEQLPNLSNSYEQIPIVLISDVEDFDCVMGAIQRGVKGYIPTSLDLKVTMGIIELVKLGGTFVPASTLVAAKRSGRFLSEATTKATRGILFSASFSDFTHRQMAVVNAVRQGKANKIIAYELNMCESTVKVHVRNIMRKLKATNRTEVAYLFSKAFSLKDAGPNGSSAADSST